MKVASYNGWTNWDTWNTYSILSSYEREWNQMRKVCKKPGFKTEVVMALGMLCVEHEWDQDALPNVEEINYFELKRAFLDGGVE